MSFECEVYLKEMINAAKTYLDEPYPDDLFEGAQDALEDLRAMCENEHNKDKYRNLYYLLERLVYKTNDIARYETKEIAKEKTIKWLKEDRQYTDSDIEDWMWLIDEIVDKHWNHLNAIEMGTLIDAE